MAEILEKRFNVEVTGANESNFVGTIMYLQERLVQTKGKCNWSVYIRPGIADVVTDKNLNIGFDDIRSADGLYNALWTNEFTRMNQVTFVYENVTEEHIKTILNFISAMNLPFTSIKKYEIEL